MAIELTTVEARILGVLVEKSVTTPDSYPLTNNALRLACNQKSNRVPVVSYDDREVEEGIRTLMRMHLVLTKGSAEHRVTRYAHRFESVFALTPAQAAVLCVLLLRGPQTIGEIRSHAMRLFAFENIGAVRVVIDELSQHKTMCFLTSLPRQAGMKECRYVHLLTDGETLLEDIEKHKALQPVVVKQEKSDALSDLKEQIMLLKDEVVGLRKALMQLHPESSWGPHLVNNKDQEVSQ